MSRRLIGPALALLLVGCGEGLGPFARAAVVTDLKEYRRGESITVTTLDRSGDDIYDNHCAGVVEGFDYLGYWNGSYGSGRACLPNELGDSHLKRIAPGEVHVDYFYVNSMAYEGSWRVQLELQTAGGRRLPLESRVSNTFRVIVD